MPKYVFAYHGGKMPESAEEGARQMERWHKWFAKMGEAVLDSGNPVGPSRTIYATGVEENGGANPLSGYSLISAQSIGAAIVLANDCPILDHGSVEIAEAMDIEM